MSKTNQAVFSGHEMAEKFYSVPRSEFVNLAQSTLGFGTMSYKAAIDAFDDIQTDLGNFFAEVDEDFIPAWIDKDGVPF